MEHSEICAVPEQRLASKRELLGGLPSLRPALPGHKVEKRKVDRLSCIRFGSARYSVPMRLIGTTVELRSSDGVLAVLELGTGVILAEHTLVAPGEACIHDEHYNGPRPSTPRRAVRPKTTAEKRFCSFGPLAEAFLTGAIAVGNTRLGGELDELLALEAAYGRDPMLAALARATAFRRWHAEDVRSILAAGAATPSPQPAGEALVIDLPTVATRALGDYAWASDQPPGNQLPGNVDDAAGDAS